MPVLRQEQVKAFAFVKDWRFALGGHPQSLAHILLPASLAACSPKPYLLPPLLIPVVLSSFFPSPAPICPAPHPSPRPSLPLPPVPFPPSPPSHLSRCSSVRTMRPHTYSFWVLWEGSVAVKHMCRGKAPAAASEGSRAKAYSRLRASVTNLVFPMPACRAAAAARSFRAGLQRLCKILGWMVHHLRTTHTEA